MGTLSRITVVGMVFLLAAVSVPLHAQWVENGIGICTGPDYKYDPRMLPDGSGGAFIVWYDYRNGNHDIYAQRLDALGNELWTSGGIPVCTAAGTQFYPAIVSDGEGGIILGWYDSRNNATTGSDIYVQRIDGNGNAVWASDGVPACDHPGDQQSPFMASDGQGGAIIAWNEPRVDNHDILAQRIDGNGNTLWTPDGILVCTESLYQYMHDIVADGTGGAVIVWRDYRDSNFDIYAQRVLSDSTAFWTADGLSICTAASTQTSARVIKDITGGFIIAWEDYRSGNGDIYAQKVSLGGARLWTADGIAVCTETGYQENVRMVSDGGWGAIIAWEDRRASPTEIYAQKITGAGVASWTSGGELVSGYTGKSKADPQMVSDGEGGTVFTWRDYRSGTEYNLYAERIDGDCIAQWSTYGVPLRTAMGNADHVSIVSDGAGGAIFAWQDMRNLTDYDIYSQRIERNGYWGYPAPSISGVRDVPGDQGGRINLAWDASRLDPWPSEEIYQYGIWRAIDETQALALLDNGGALLAGSPESGLSTGTPTVRIQQLGASTFYWEQIELVYANHEETYSMVVPTLFDSSDATDEYHYFQVTAYTEYYEEYWTSAPDSGYSVDNLAPAPPLGLAGEQIWSPEGILLTWDPNIESDLAGYNIYRGTSSGFTPGAGNFVTSTPDTMTLDGDWSWEAGYWYKVSAVDIHGNESFFAVTGPNDVTGDDPAPLPDATFLSQNYPNPFNPITDIAFGLKESGYISIRIYDAAGRLVTTLVDESRPAGRYTTEWNGQNTDGSSAASGVYFYRLTTKEFEETKKMILLR